MATSEERRLQRRADALQAELDRRRTPSQRQAEMATLSADAHEGDGSATERQVAAARSVSERQARAAQGVDFDELSPVAQRRRLIAEAFQRGQ